MPDGIAAHSSSKLREHQNHSCWSNKYVKQIWGQTNMGPNKYGKFPICAAQHESQSSLPKRAFGLTQTMSCTNHTTAGLLQPLGSIAAPHGQPQARPYAWRWGSTPMCVTAKPCPAMVPDANSEEDLLKGIISALITSSYIHEKRNEQLWKL